MKKILILAALVGLSFFASISVFAKEILPTPAKEQQAKWEEQAKSDLEMVVVNSHGSQYRMLAPNCGYINPQNKSGGFMGYMKFSYYTNKEGQIDASFESQPYFFQSAWRYACGVKLEK